MAEIGLFPLELVLLPTERIPLHIFEPRYKELVAECLATGSEFGLVLAEDGAVHEIGTRARVGEVLDVADDGRMNIVIEGGSRFRLLELTSGRSFQTGEIEPVGDEDDPPETADAERALELFRRLSELTEAEVEIPAPDSPELSFELAARVAFGTAIKQELLAMLSPRRRLARLSELMQQAVEALVLETELRERASKNGKVAPLDPA